MTSRTVSASEFKATCLRLIDEMNQNKQPITITKRGKPVAVLKPMEDGEPASKSIIGIMKGFVLRYDDPFEPAIDPMEWDALK